MAIDLQLASMDDSNIPGQESFELWVEESLFAIGRRPEDLTIRLVDEEEITDLNFRFRSKNKPTNVLAFPFEPIDGVDYQSLGDVVICVGVVKNQAEQQGITFLNHLSHMVIHGTLHLCGYDHVSDDQAVIMEAVEKGILAKLALVNQENTDSILPTAT